MAEEEQETVEQIKQELQSDLAAKKQEIDQRIGKYLPRQISDDYLQWLISGQEIEYELDEEAIQGSLSEPIWDFLDRGGKRWRPYLFYLIADAFDADVDNIGDFMIVSELLHNGSIIVDDLEDKGELRRGEQALHLKFGDDFAINAGNFLYFLPYKVFAENEDKLEQEALLRSYKIWLEEMVNIHLGQGLDIYWHNLEQEIAITEAEYFQMCSFKTGCLARLSARLAVALAGASKEKELKIGRLAGKIGVGFQIQDDILDIKSTESEDTDFGKQYGNDIKEGKKTLMVLYTLKKANKQEAKESKEILARKDNSVQEIDKVIELLRRYDSIQYAKRKARGLVEAAWQEAGDLIPDSQSKDKLRKFIRFLVERDV